MRCGTTTMILVRAAAAQEADATRDRTNRTEKPKTKCFFIVDTPYALCSACLKLLIDSSLSAPQTCATNLPKRSEEMIDESRGCGKSMATISFTLPGRAVMIMTRSESCTDSL